MILSQTFIVFLVSVVVVVNSSISRVVVFDKNNFEESLHNHLTIRSNFPVSSGLVLEQTIDWCVLCVLMFVAVSITDSTVKLVKVLKQFKYLLTPILHYRLVCVLRIGPDSLEFETISA